MVIQERCENMMEYIKRLRLCIKWFQELEGEYAFEQEKLSSALELIERRCSEMGMYNLFTLFCMVYNCIG